MKIIKKNQIIIFVIALMLITAGYLNFTADNGDDIVQTNAETKEIAGIGDAKLVNGNAQELNDDKSIEESSSISSENTIEKNNSTIETKDNNADKNSLTLQNKKDEENLAQTSAKVKSEVSDDYFTNSKLTRDTMYSQMIESYQKILDNSAISAEQKAISRNRN